MTDIIDLDNRRKEDKAIKPHIEAAKEFLSDQSLAAWKVFCTYMADVLDRAHAEAFPPGKPGSLEVDLQRVFAMHGVPAAVIGVFVLRDSPQGKHLVFAPTSFDLGINPEITQILEKTYTVLTGALKASPLIRE